ncbi:unnamed protein product [Peniophora sp. CBMAI 1063]|nr:unnamed protein product [Peniophora sp. CBMAI 1063]
MSSANGSTSWYHPTAREGDASSHYEPQHRAWGGYGCMPYHHEPPAFLTQANPYRVPQSAHVQARYDAVPIDHYGYTATHGSAGYVYWTTNPAPAPIAHTAGFSPLPPHNTKTRESGQSFVASNDAPHPVEVGYAESRHRRHVHHSYLHGHCALPLENASTNTQPYTISNDWWQPSIVPPIPEASCSQSSSLSNALGDITFKFDLPTSLSPSTRAPPPLSASAQPPSSQNVSPRPPIHGFEALPITPDKIEDIEQDHMHDVSFIHETGSPDLTTPSTSLRARPSGSPAETEPQPRRVKRTRGPNKGPRKDPGFVACFFCRGRKISCNPVPGSEDKRCE